MLYRDKTVAVKRKEIALTGAHTNTQPPPNPNLLITPTWHNADPGCYKWRVLCKERKPPSSHHYKVFWLRYEMKMISPETWSLCSRASWHKWHTQQALEGSAPARHVSTEPILSSNFSRQLFLFFPLKFQLYSNNIKWGCNAKGSRVEIQQIMKFSIVVAQILPSKINCKMLQQAWKSWTKGIQTSESNQAVMNLSMNHKYWGHVSKEPLPESHFQQKILRDALTWQVGCTQSHQQVSCLSLDFYVKLGIRQNSLIWPPLRSDVSHNLHLYFSLHECVCPVFLLLGASDRWDRRICHIFWSLWTFTLFPSLDSSFTLVWNLKSHRAFALFSFIIPYSPLLISTSWLCLTVLLYQITSDKPLDLWGIFVHSCTLNICFCFRSLLLLIWCTNPALS